VERFVTLYDGDAQSTVNTSTPLSMTPRPALSPPTAYLRGRQLATARNKHTTFQIVPILVLGVVTEDGIKSVTPALSSPCSKSKKSAL